MDTKQQIIDKYLEYVKTTNKIPSRANLLQDGISRDQIRHHYGNMEILHEYIYDNYKKLIDENVVSEKTVFSKIRLENLNDSVKSFNRFVVSTVVNGKSVDENFYWSLKNYCIKNSAVLILIPCADVASTRKIIEWNFAPILSNEFFAYKDVRLNDNLFISSIKLSAKQIEPTTGLNRIGQRNGSYIFASPKQFLEYVVTSPETDRLPHAIMTTGALTKADYHSDRYMSERTSYIAENDHIIGALVVEIEDDKIFHFRQIQADSNGCFIDLGTKYYPDGSTTKKEATLVLGDWHSGYTDESVKKTLPEIIQTANVRDIFLHDFFDGKSISHHDLPFPLKLAKKANDNKLSLQTELEEGAKDLNWLSSVVSGNIYMVKGNHDEFLERYLIKGTYVQDPINHYMSLSLAKELLDGNMPLKYAYENYTKLDEPDKIIWLKRDQEHKISGVELAQHGDLGLNGSRASLRSLEKSFGDCVIGHTHSAAILRGVYRVGTSTKLRLDYTVGPTSWTHTHCLVYDNGSRQLINIIKGKWKI